MNKTEIQSRIEGVESMLESVQKNQDSLKSILTSLKADLAKCDCTDGIEQEKCWHVVSTESGRVLTVDPATMEREFALAQIHKVAYMPECRQVTAEDVARIPCFIPVQQEEMARELHKLGFRMKVTK